MQFGIRVRRYIGLAGAAVIAFGAVAARANEVQFVSEPFGTTGGGEFRWRAVDPTAAWAGNVAPTISDASSTGQPLWTSFCVEYNEEIEFGHTYQATLTTAALGGGQGGGVNGVDPLDARTAYLITAFSAGTLAGYNLSPSGTNAAGLTRVNTANALQLAIWWIEEEFHVGANVGLTAPELTLAQTFFDASNVAVAPGGGWSGLGNVRIMHVETDAGLAAQDQVVITQSPAVVPLPPAAVAGGVGLLGLFVRRSRRAVVAV